MATVNELRMEPSVPHAYLLLIAGVPFAFTDERALTTESGGWWSHDDRRIIGGLRVPGSLGFSLDRETGLLEENGADFEVLDLDGTVPGFFGGLQKTYNLLGQRLTPLDSPAPVLIDAYGDALALDEGGYLGTEAIGPAGERGHYSCVPFAVMPGQDHPAIDEPRPVFTSPETGPLLVEGRRVTLYRILFDPDTGTWLSFEEHASAALGAGRNPALWWGTLRQAGRVEGRIWTLTCTGPGSWIRRSLATRSTTKWYPVTSDVQFTDEERTVGIDFYKVAQGGFGLWYGTDHITYSIPDGTADAVASYLGLAINTVANLNMNSGRWTDNIPIEGAAGSINFDIDGCTIATAKDCGHSGMLCLVLHLKVWRLLGYDPLFELGSLDGPQPIFSKAGFTQPIYLGIFTTTPAGKDPIGQDGSYEWDGDGVPRTFTPLYPGGVSVISGKPGPSGILVKLTPDDNEDIYVESQTVRPVPGGEIEGTPTDAWRWWVFKGPIQRVGQEEPEDTMQFARCSWVTAFNGAMESTSEAVNRGLLVHEWLDPRLFGYNYEPLDPKVGWASNNGAEDADGQIQASPLSVFGAYHLRPDRATDTILRTLLSTGSAAWDDGISDVADDAIDLLAAANLAVGQNSQGEDVSYPGNDSEIYDLSLQYPKDMIDLKSFANAADDLPEGSECPLAFGKVAIQGRSVQSEELFSALMSSRGWSFGLKCGRLGLFTPHKGCEGEYQEGIDFDITVSDLHGDAGNPASTIPPTELRPVFPFDRLVLKYTGNPCESWLDGQNEYAAKARDIGARARSGTRTRDVQGPDLISTEWFVGDEAKLVKSEYLAPWQSPFRKLWERDVPTYLAQPHRQITLRITRPKGQDIYPGAILRLSNPWPANSTGGYGFTGAYARVLRANHETDSCACEVEALVEAQPPNALRWAPIIRVVDAADDTDDRYIASDRTFFLQFWGGSPPPLPAFIKPATLDAPDAPAKVFGLQFDGVTWQQTFTALVDSVNTVTNSLTHTSMGLTGIFMPRQYCVIVMAPADDPDQAEWVRILYARHTSLPPSNTAPKLPL